MSSLILRTAARYIFPLMLLFSIFLFLRGHNEPGGGFVGGLVAAAAYILYAVAEGVPAARRMLVLNPRTISGLGLLMPFSSGLLSLVRGEPFLSEQWLDLQLPLFGVVTLGTPLLFDLGVYLVVLGVTLTIILSLAEE